MDKEEQGLHHEFVEQDATVTHLYLEDSRGHITNRVLIPTPTNDPHDPLTWSLPRKTMAFASISFFVFLSNYTLASITPGLLLIARDFGFDIRLGSYLISTQLLLLGVGTLFWIPLSRKIGKRPVVLAGSVLFFASSIWSAKSGSYGSLLGSRLVAGFAASLSEVIGPSMVADMYFLHQRGLMIGIYSLMISSGASFGGLFAGFVIHSSHDWRWTFWMNSILTGTLVLGVCAFLPETNYDRPATTEQGGQPGGLDEVPKKSLVNRRYGVTSWYDSKTSFWWHLWQPFTMFAYPAVILVILNYGAVLGWVAVLVTANASALPRIYHFTPLGVGNANIACIIGSLIGCAVGGYLSDRFVAFMSKRNHGVFKPEFRLICLIVPAVFTPIGLLMWGAGLGHKLPWAVSVFGWAIVYGCLCATPAIGITYVVDCFRPQSNELITGLTASKNTISFALSFGATPWLERDGYLAVGGYMTLISTVFYLAIIPLYYYGERLRQWSHPKV